MAAALFAALYGSFARGTEVVGESDVDLLVTLNPDSSRAAFELEEWLTARTGEAVQIVRLSQAERDPRFLLNAILDARPLVDRDGDWAILKGRTESLQAAAERQAAARSDRIARNLALLSS
jgi:predicted nucleotidyltransferase